MAADERKPTYDELADLVRDLLLRIADLEAERERDKDRIAQQDKRIAELERQLAAAKKNSSNSSKPPSSDITKPPKHGKSTRRKRSIGGQKGHPKQESNLSVDDADDVKSYYADQYSENLERDLVPAPGLEPRILFQYEFADAPVVLTAHVSYPYMDRETDEVVYAPFPREVEAAGVLGPRLTSFVACLKGGIHASYTGVEKVLGFLDVDICRATICKKINKVSAALGFAYEELLQAVSSQAHLNIDETGHKDHPFDKPADHKKHWIWVFAAPIFTVFRIFGSRSTDALREVLGPDCEAIIGSDLYNAYTCFMKEANVKVQLCWAHLIRDIKFLSESGDPVTANYANRMLELCKSIFHLQHRREELGERIFRRRMFKLKEQFLATGRRSQASGARNMAKRLKDYGEEYFLFLENPQIEPTNNLAEREVRHCVIDRRITQGTRGQAGQRWCERIWTVLATCARQDRDAFAFITNSLCTFYAGQPQPSLLPVAQTKHSA
jgi:transposase